MKHLARVLAIACVALPAVAQADVASYLSFPKAPFASAGFTRVQAIQIATSNGAEAMRRFDRIGSIEPGKNADLVLLDGDVARDITAIEGPVMVVRGVIAYNPKKLIDATVGLRGTR